LVSETAGWQLAQGWLQMTRIIIIKPQLFSHETNTLLPLG